ncbi:hypothetical protein [Clostridium mediterraneense]|nr:hypothetical protein [Clostridium mediterraneense]
MGEHFKSLSAVIPIILKENNKDIEMIFILLLITMRVQLKLWKQINVQN